MSGEKLNDITDNSGQGNDSGQSAGAAESPASDNKADSSSGASAPPLDYKSLVGQTLFDKYTITHLLSLNDLSVVYKATDISTNKTVVMKTLVARDREIRKLFFQEVRKLETIEHQNLVQFIEFKAPFYVMEFLDGISFEKVLGKAPKIDSPSHLVKIIEPICKGLAFVHQSQIFHGRLSPSDVILVKESDQHVVKVLGFGCSRIQSALRASGELAINSPFMNPDHALNFEPTIQDDVYGIGALVYNTVTGRLPFISESGEPMDSLEPIPAISPKLPNAAELNEIIVKALSRDPDEQYPSVHHLRSAITSWSKPPRDLEGLQPVIQEVAQTAPQEIAQPVAQEIAQPVAQTQPAVAPQAVPTQIPQPPFAPQAVPAEIPQPTAAPQAVPAEIPQPPEQAPTPALAPSTTSQVAAELMASLDANPMFDVVTSPAPAPDSLPDSVASAPFRSRLQEAVSSVASSESTASMTPRMMLDFGDDEGGADAPSQALDVASQIAAPQLVNPQAAHEQGVSAQAGGPGAAGFGPGIAGFGPGIADFAPNAPGLTTSGAHPTVTAGSPPPDYSRQITGPLPPAPPPRSAVVDQSLEMHSNLAPVVIPGNGPGGAQQAPAQYAPVMPPEPPPMMSSQQMQAPAPAGAAPQAVADGEEVYFLGQTLFERYSVLDAIGETDVSIVYAAKDLIDEQLVAVKTIKLPDPETAAAFSKGVQEISTYTHKTFVQFLNYKQSETHPFYFMELVEALTLADLAGEYIEKAEQIADCILQLCEAIGYIHGAKRYHGNLTPRSIMLIEDGDKLIVKICGFGTEPVRAIRYSRGTIPIDYNVYPNADLFNQIGRTQKGDVFCVAAILYQMVAGTLPFVSQSTVISHVEPVSKVRAELPGVGILDDVFKKALDSDPNNQYESIAALEEALKEWIRLIHGEVVPSPEKGASTSAVRRWTKDTKKPEVASPAAAPIPVEDHSHSHTKTSEWPELPSQSSAMPARRWTREVQDGEPDEHEHLREDIAGLKNRQVQQEKTMIIQLAKAVGGGRSPVRVMVETGLLIVGGCLCLFAVIHYGFTNYDSLMDQYWNASRRLSSQVSGTEWTPSSGSGGFDYKKDSNYQPWSNNPVVGEPRVVGPDGILETK